MRLQVSEEPQARIFLFAHLRTRSNLLIRLLETHPRVLSNLYPFKDAFMNGPECQNALSTKNGRAMGIGKSLKEFEEEFRGTTFQAGLDAVEKTLAQAKLEGKTAVVKEHTCYLLESSILNTNVCCAREERPRPVLVDHHLDIQSTLDSEFEASLTQLPISNPTLLPDRLAVTFIPVFMIRHPAYTFPSALRASSSYGAKVFDPDFAIIATYRWQRIVFDFYRGLYEKKFKGCPQRRNWPVVVDGDRLVNDTKNLMTKFCEMVGLEESQIQYSWDSRYSQRNAIWDAFVKVAEESTGVIKNPEPIRPPDLAQEIERWESEWDTDVAEKLREFVELAMDDYNHLLRHSLVAS